MRLLQVTADHTVLQTKHYVHEKWTGSTSWTEYKICQTILPVHTEYKGNQRYTIKNWRWTLKPERLSVSLPLPDDDKIFASSYLSWLPFTPRPYAFVPKNAQIWPVSTVKFNEKSVQAKSVHKKLNGMCPKYRRWPIRCLIGHRV
jgi:hypothetical protein